MKPVSRWQVEHSAADVTPPGWTTVPIGGVPVPRKMLSWQEVQMVVVGCVAQRAASGASVAVSLWQALQLRRSCGYRTCE